MAGFFKNARKGRNKTETSDGQVGFPQPGGAADPGAVAQGYPQPGAQAGQVGFPQPGGAADPGAPQVIDNEQYYRLDLPHGFNRPMNVGVPAEELPYLSYPEAPEGLPEGAEEYAERWWEIWGTMVDRHIDVARAGEAGNIAQAEQLLFNWEEAIRNAGSATWDMSDFQGGHTLKFAADEVCTCYLEVVDALHDYLRVQAGGGDTSETIEDTHIAIGNLHIELNRSVATFFADPLVTIAPNMEAGSYKTGGYGSIDISAPGSAAAGTASGLTGAPAFSGPAPADVAGLSGTGPLEEPGAAGPRALPGADGVPDVPGTSGSEVAPVHGVTLHDYAAGSSRIQEGFSPEVVCQLLGVARPVWDAAAAEWGQRVTAYPTTAGAQYAALQATAHPRLSPEACAAAVAGEVPPSGAGPAAGPVGPAADPAAAPAASPVGPAADPAARLGADTDFYVEVMAAATAVSEAGGDAGKYVEQGYGVSLAQLTTASAAWTSAPGLQEQVAHRLRVRADQIFEQVTGHPRTTKPGTLPNGVEDLAADVDF